MNEKEWLSVSEISDNIDVPAETVRRYVRQHGKWLKLHREHKKYLVHRESIKVIEQIRELYVTNHSIKEVEETLSNTGTSMTITIHDGDERMTVSVADELKKLNESMEQQQAFNKLLLEKLNEQSNYIGELESEFKKRDKQQQILIESQGNRENERDERLMNEVKQQQERMEQGMVARDERLMAVVRELQEQKQMMLESAASKEEETKKGFWAKLFGE